MSAHRSNQHVVHECSQTPPVHCFTMACPLQYLRGPVRGRGEEWAGESGDGIEERRGGEGRGGEVLREGWMGVESGERKHQHPHTHTHTPPEHIHAHTQGSSPHSTHNYVHPPLMYTSPYTMNVAQMYTLQAQHTFLLLHTHTHTHTERDIPIIPHYTHMYSMVPHHTHMYSMVPHHTHMYSMVPQNVLVVSFP